MQYLAHQRRRKTAFRAGVPPTPVDRKTKAPTRRHGKEGPMHERHPVETSPRYHTAIWIVVGLVVAGIAFSIVQRANEPPAQLPSNPGTQRELPPEAKDK
jgi:hypothetical protein